MKTVDEEPARETLPSEPRRPVEAFSVRVLREMRGALNEEQERELTIDQCDLLRRDGQLRLTDPETGIEYVLVPASEYDRVNGR